MTVQIVHGDCLEVLPTLDAESIDAIVTDPPYGTNTAKNVYGRRGRWEAGGAIANDNDLGTLASAAPEMFRLLRRFGVALVFCAPSKRGEAYTAIENGGLRILEVVSWDKGSPGISHRVRWSHEDIIIAGHWGADPWDSREPLISPFRVPRLQQTEHPNEKPVALYRRLIRWALPTGGIVLDPFAGIASCGVGAIAEKCDYIGIECDVRWVPIATRRLAEAQNQRHDDIPQESLFSGEVA